jgi:hypothetical protein
MLHAHGHRNRRRELSLSVRQEEETGQPARAHEGVAHGGDAVLVPLVFHEDGLTTGHMSSIDSPTLPGDPPPPRVTMRQKITCKG